MPQPLKATIVIGMYGQLLETGCEPISFEIADPQSSDIVVLDYEFGPGKNDGQTINFPRSELLAVIKALKELL